MPLSGAQKHRNRLQKLASSKVKDLAGAIVFEGADTIRADAFRKISAGSVSGAGHVASKPGEYPNRDTGDLQGGLQAERTGQLSAEVRSTSRHARPLNMAPAKWQHGHICGLRAMLRLKEFAIGWQINSENWLN